MEDAPYVTTVDTLDKYNIDFCVHGGRSFLPQLRIIPDSGDISGIVSVIMSLQYMFWSLFRTASERQF